MLKQISVFILASFFFVPVFAQKTVNQYEKKREEKLQKKNRINEIIRNEEEGIPAFAKHNLFNFNLNHDGYSLILEKGWMKTPYKSTIVQLEIAEKRHPKEEKQGTTSFSNSGFVVFGRPFVYGKQNIFYQAKLGLGKQLMIGGKTNKNGVAVYFTFLGGFSAGLERPYYLEFNATPVNVKIKYTEQNRSQFLNPDAIIGGTGLQKGWNEMKFNPGAYAKAGFRFDWARFNQVVSAIEFGFSAEYYSKKVVQMVDNPGKSFFPTGYVGLVFGNRK
jgi:hypothetical protein